MLQPELPQDFLEDQADTEVAGNQVDAMLSTLGLTLNLRNYIWAAFTEDEIAQLQANLHFHDRNATLGLILPLIIEREELQSMSEQHSAPVTKLDSGLDALSPRQYLQVRYYFGSLTYRYLHKLERILQQARRERVCGLGRGVEIQLQQSPYLFNYCRSLDDEYLQVKRQQHVQQLTLNNIRTQMQLEAAKHTLTQDVVQNIGVAATPAKSYITKPYSPLEVENHEQVQVQIARASLKFLAGQEPAVAQALQGVDIDHLSYARLYELLQTLQWSLPEVTQVKNLLNQLLLTEKVTAGQMFDTWQLQQSIAHNANVVNFGGEFASVELEQRVLAQDIEHLASEVRAYQQARQAWAEFGQEQQDLADPVVLPELEASDVHSPVTPSTAHVEVATSLPITNSQAVPPSQESTSSAVTAFATPASSITKNTHDANVATAAYAQREQAINPLLPQANKITLAQRARQGRLSPSLAIQQGVNFVAHGTNPFHVDGLARIAVTTAHSQSQGVGQTQSALRDKFSIPQVENLTWEQRLELGSRTIFVTSPEQIPAYYCSLLVLSLAGEDRSKLMRTPYTQSNATFEYFSNAFGRKEDYSKFKGVLERQQQRITQELDFAKRVRRLHHQTLSGTQTEQLNRQVNDILVNYVYNQNTIPVQVNRVELLEKRLVSESSLADWDEEVSENTPTYEQLVEQLVQEYQAQPQDLRSLQELSEPVAQPQESNAATAPISPAFLDKYFTQNLPGEARALFEKSYRYVAQQLGRWQQLYQEQMQLHATQFAPVLQATAQQLQQENQHRWFRNEQSSHAVPVMQAPVSMHGADMVHVYAYAWQLGQLLGQVQQQAQQQVQTRELNSLQFALHCDAYLRSHPLEIPTLSSWRGTNTPYQPQEAVSKAQYAMHARLSGQVVTSQVLRVLFQFYIKHDLAGFLVALCLQQPALLHSYLGINQLEAQQLAQQDLLRLFHPQPTAEFLRWSSANAAETGQGFTVSDTMAHPQLPSLNNFTGDKYHAARRAVGQRVTQQFTQAADQIINHLEQMLEVNQKLLGTAPSPATDKSAPATNPQGQGVPSSGAAPTHALAQEQHQISTMTMLSKQGSTPQLTTSAFGAIDPHQESVFAQHAQETPQLSAQDQLDAMIAMVEGQQAMPNQVRLALADYQQRLEARAAQVRQEYLHGDTLGTSSEAALVALESAALQQAHAQESVASTSTSSVEGQAGVVAPPTRVARELVNPAELTSSLDRLLEGDYSQADFSSLEQERQAFANHAEKRRVEMFVSDSIEAFRQQIRRQVHEYLPEIIAEYYVTLDFKNLGKQVRVYLHQQDPLHKSLPLGFGSQGYLQHLEELAEHNLEQELERQQDLTTQGDTSEVADIFAADQDLAAALELGLISAQEYVETEHDYLSEPYYSRLNPSTLPQQQTRSVLSLVQANHAQGSVEATRATATTSVEQRLPDLDKVFANFAFEKMCLPAAQQFTIGEWAFDLKYLTSTYLFLELQHWNNLVEFYETYKAHRKSLDKAAFEKFMAVLPLDAVVERIFGLLQPYLDLDLLALHKVYTLEDYAQLAQKYQGRSSEVKQYRLSMQEQVTTGISTLHKLARDWTRPPRELKILKEAPVSEQSVELSAEAATSAADESSGISKQLEVSHAALSKESTKPSAQKTQLQAQVAQAMQELQAAMQRNATPATGIQDANIAEGELEVDASTPKARESASSVPNPLELVNWEVDLDKVVPDFERQLQDEATKLHNFMTTEYQLPEITDYLDKAQNNTALILSRLEAALEQKTVVEIASQQAKLTQQLEQARELLAQGLSMQQRQAALAQAQAHTSVATSELAAHQQQVTADKMYQLQQQIDHLKAQLQELAQPRPPIEKLEPTQAQQVWLDLGVEYAQQIQLNAEQHQEYHRRLQELRADLAQLDEASPVQPVANTQASERQAQRLMQQKLSDLELLRVEHLDLSDARLSKKLLQQLQREKEILAFAQATTQDPRGMLFKSQENYLCELAMSKTRRQKGKIYETVYFGYANNPEGEFVYPVAQKVISKLQAEGLPCTLQETPWLQERATAEVATGTLADTSETQVLDETQSVLASTTKHEGSVGRQELAVEYSLQVLPEKTQYDYSHVFKKARQELQRQGVETGFEIAPTAARDVQASLVETQLPEAHLIAPELTSTASSEVPAVQDNSTSVQDSLAPPELENLLRQLLGLQSQEPDPGKDAVMQEFAAQQQEQLVQAETQLEKIFATWSADESVKPHPVISRVQARLEQMTSEQRVELAQRVAQRHVRLSVQQRFHDQQALREQGLEVIDGRYFTAQDAVARALDELEAQEAQTANALQKRQRKATRERKSSS